MSATTSLPVRATVSVETVRAALVGVLLLAATAGFLVTSAHDSATAVMQAGPELTRLLRGMALIKTLFAALAAAAVWWRFGAPVSPVRFATYALAAAATAAGPGLIWDMAHVRLGALLLHGGLAATVLLVWRDPGTSARMATVAALRRMLH